MRLYLLILLIFDPLFAQSPSRKNAVAETGWNVVFGTDPGSGNYDGVKGKPGHTWNFMDVGDTNLSSLRDIRGKHTEVSCRLSENDGEWGITGHAGVYHAYLYHNSRDRDLEAIFDGLPPGKYFVCVYAHGDAPNQNANIELRKDNKILGKRSTLNDGTWEFRSLEFEEGNQYVSFHCKLRKGEDLKIISHRDGSSYSMLNAIQIVPAKEGENRIFKRQRVKAEKRNE